MLLNSFFCDLKASAVPMFGLAFLTLTAATGAAVDYGRSAAARTSMQNALDSTGLMLSKEAEGLAPETLTQKAGDYFHAIYNGKFAKSVQVTADITSPQPGSYALHLTAASSLPATLTAAFGYANLEITATTDIAWGIKKLELALVLDNTGSMASAGKLTALKQAAHNLLATLQNAAKKPGDVKVAIIPFDTTVNIGTGYKDASWIDYSVKNIQKNDWEGCIIDRDQSNDVQDTTPTTSNYHTLFPAANCGALTTAMPLSTDWTALNAKVDQMTAAGNTNVTLGLVWGWHALTPNLPFTEAAEPAPDLDKVIVLLTDGDNTQNRWTTQGSKIDARTSLACANAKAAGIRIYTVRVINGDASLLQGCATKPQMYYDVQQASQLNAAFSSIAQSLASLRISK
ncbi:MAG: VWA domain-containing protein [Hyphomicrobiales bacterium]|nr:VWA domain-containing protein [Hyphomicrobiales bacterium]